jgi:hypothetical protein
MTTNTNDIAAMFAAFMAAQQVEAPAPMTRAEKARAKRAEDMRISKDAQDDIADAEAEAEDTGKDTLYALRHGAVSGYGSITRYGAGLNKAFGKGWTLFTKGHPMWDRVEMERKSFVALCKDRGVGNPADYWKKSKAAAVKAEGGAKKGTPEPRAIKARLLDDCGKLYVAILRDADEGKQPANVKKAGELIAGAIQTLGGDLAPLAAQAKKALPGRPKGS